MPDSACGRRRLFVVGASAGGRQLVFALLDDFDLACERVEQQLADAAEQPGGRVNNFQWHAEQGVAQRQNGVRIRLASVRGR